ncbi:hypothetical protein AURDEDRAFT_185293 [Auricularia subglabra TFB-10046 SS5]|nr:hypothetical protein AURDEDRAFT_185293 [Auricularia subglabra TFB-10046 SS5]
MVVRYLDVQRFSNKFVLSAICSRWRDTVIADQWIWADIYLTVPPQNVDLLALALKRAGQSALSVGILFEFGPRDDQLTDAMKYLATCTATVRHLRLEFMFMERQLDFFLSGAHFPELLSLTLASHGGHPVHLDLTMPKLQYIEINGGVPFSQWTPLLGQCTETVILKGDVPILDFWDFYKGCEDRNIPLAHLEFDAFCEVEPAILSDVYGRPPIYLPTMRRLDASSYGVSEIRRAIPTDPLAHILVYNCFPDSSVYNLWQIWRPEERAITRICVSPDWEIDLEGTCPELAHFKRSLRIGIGPMVSPASIHVNLLEAIQEDVPTLDKLASIAIPLRLWAEFIEFSQERPFAVAGLRMEFFFEGTEACQWEGMKAKCPKLVELTVRPFTPLKPSPRISYGALRNMVGSFESVEKDVRLCVRDLSLWGNDLPPDNFTVLRRLLKVSGFPRWKPVKESTS